MSRLVTPLGLATLALAFSALPAGAAEAEPFTMMSPAEVSKALGASDVKVYDANSAAVFAKGHVPGARLVDYQGFTAGDLPADKATRVIFYCKNTH